jgi:hypothetical protein
MRNIQLLKQFVKDTASQIRAIKLLKLQYEYRHHHIAYCELRGRTRLQIEPKTREHNEPNENYIKQIKEKYAWTIEEIEAYKERKDAKALHTCQA